MKKILVLLAAFSISAGVASAQTAAQTKLKAKTERTDKAHKTPEQKAEHAAKRLAEKLNLSAEQTEKVRQLHLARYQQVQAKRAQQATAGKSKEQRHALKGEKAQYEAQLKQILTADQYAKYAQLRAEKAEKHKASHKAKS